MAVAEFPTRLTISKAPQGRGAGEDVRGRAERGSAATAPMRVPVVVADRHVYLTADLIEELFCDNYRLHRQTALSQPTQFLSHELVNLIGPQGRLDKVRVIGPPRAMNQIELSLADARKLGIEAPLRESGSLVDTPGILIEGPRTCARLEGGVIRALRHVHMSREDAAMYGFHDHDHIDVLAQDDPRRILVRDVLVRVAPEYRGELHLDEEEGSAAGLHSGDHVLLARSKKRRRPL